jgi:uncharacterized delta-60 repeat protein
MGRIVVAGRIVSSTTGYDLVLLRLTSDGRMDTSFGQGGVVTLVRPGDQFDSAVVVQPDGKIVVAANTNEDGLMHLIVQRFLPSGDVDTAFGNMGIVLMPLDSMKQPFSGVHMVQMRDGRLVVAGNGTFAGTTGQVFARLSSDGTPDPTFGSSGELGLYVGPGATLQSMTLESDGKLLLAGTYPNAYKSFIARIWN